MNNAKKVAPEDEHNKQPMFDSNLQWNLSIKKYFYYIYMKSIFFRTDLWYFGRPHTKPSF